MILTPKEFAQAAANLEARENSVWIKMSERKPTEADLPVWYTGKPGRYTGFYRQLSNHEGWTHWMHAEMFVPAPPAASDLTQAEKDRQAFLEWNKNNDNGMMLCSWLNGIKYERNEVATLVAQYNSGDLKSHEFIHAVSERCK